MQPPDEMMSQTFLPAMRQLVATRLRSQGLPQSRISGMLGTTQASVSLYLSADPGKAYSALERFAISREDADSRADRLAEAVKAGPSVGVEALHSMWTSILGKGDACRYHRELYPSLADCDICVREFGARARRRTDLISEVTRAVRLVEGSPDFVKVMPEVSVNIACAPLDAASPAEVVAVPGRIVRVKDRARAMLPPEAGGSAHLSKVLIMVMKRRKDVRACINIRYDARVASVMRRRHMRTLSIGGYRRTRGEDATADALERRLGSSPEAFDAVVDEGGSGIEPNVYLFAEGALEAAEIALKVARDYSAR